MKDKICLENYDCRRSSTIRMHNGGSFEGVFVIDVTIIVWIFHHIKAIDTTIDIALKHFNFLALATFKDLGFGI